METLKLSQSIFEIPWSRYFPWKATPETEIRVSTLAASNEFFKINHATLLSEHTVHSPFVNEVFSESKRRYYEIAGDFLEFVQNGKTIGFFVGNVHDWNTYYLRFCAILPEHRGSPAYFKFLRYLLEILPAHGVERIEADVCPANFVNLHVLTKLQFNITGQLMSERWGALLHFTKFLNHKLEDTFLRQYCNSDWPQIRSRMSSVNPSSPMDV